jgi:hypothetical protein
LFLLHLSLILLFPLDRRLVIAVLLDLRIDLLNLIVDVVLLHSDVRDLLVHKTDLPADLGVLLLNMTLNLQIFISLGVVSQQLIILLDFFLKLG